MNRIYWNFNLVRFGFRMWEILIFIFIFLKWLLLAENSNKFQKTNKFLEGKIPVENMVTLAPKSTCHTSIT
jgi:hypothetical protein